VRGPVSALDRQGCPAFAKASAVAKAMADRMARKPVLQVLEGPQRAHAVRPYVIGCNQLRPYNGNGIDRLESDIE